MSGPGLQRKTNWWLVTFGSPPVQCIWFSKACAQCIILDFDDWWTCSTLVHDLVTAQRILFERHLAILPSMSAWQKNLKAYANA
jgi:hypothetical protein